MMRLIILIVKPFSKGVIPMEKENQTQNSLVIYGIIALLILIIIVQAMVAMLDDDDDDDDDEFEGTGDRAYADLMKVHVSDELVKNEQAVKSLASHIELADAFTIGDNDSIDAANAVLDTYRADFEVTVCYLMNETGVVIASTNRDTNGSFVGNNYGFRPYFQDAIAGSPGAYFALGITSGTRGYYSSFPVKAGDESVLGVVIIKKELDFLEQDFAVDGKTFLVSPDGIIFLANDPAMVMMSLWELDQATKDNLTASREFGDGPFDNVFTDKPMDGDEVKYKDIEYNVNRRPLGEGGWAVYYLAQGEHDD